MTGIAATQFLSDGVEASREAWPRWGRVSPEKGPYSYRARYYAPKIGRFLQTDPVGYDAGLHLYAYVGNDPVNLTDPIGTQTQCGSRLKARKDKNGKTVELGSASCRSIDFSLSRKNTDDIVAGMKRQASGDGASGRQADSMMSQSTSATTDEDGNIIIVVFSPFPAQARQTASGVPGEAIPTVSRPFEFLTRNGKFTVIPATSVIQFGGEKRAVDFNEAGFTLKIGVTTFAPVPKLPNLGDRIITRTFPSSLKKVRVDLGTNRKTLVRIAVQPPVPGFLSFGISVPR